MLHSVLALSLLLHLALVAADSPCQDRYAPWLSKADAFVRNDEPKELQGLHVACLWKSSGELHLEAHKNGVWSSPVKAVLPEGSLQSWKDLRKELQHALQLTKVTNNWGHFHLKQNFGIFSEFGKRLSTSEEVLEAQLVLVAEGGQWFWPPVEIGYVRSLPGTPFELETMSVQPVVFRVRGFLKDQECSKIIDLGRDQMVESPVTPMTNEHKGAQTSDFRTSTQARLGTEHKMLEEIDARVANLTRVPARHNEEAQVLRYEKTQFYSAHMDNFDPAFYFGPEDAVYEKGHRNRFITVFWYLTNVSSGGETIFPRSDGSPAPSDMKSCETGMKIRPELGTVIFWYSLRPNGNTDHNSLHGACPVEDGQKWSANYWVWNKPRKGVEPMPDWDVDEEQTSPGGAVAPQFKEIKVVFDNKHPTKSLFLFWRNPNIQQDAFLGEIKPAGILQMNSFEGHIWNIRAQNDAASKILSTKVMSADPTQHYTFKGKSTAARDGQEL